MRAAWLAAGIATKNDSTDAYLWTTLVLIAALVLAAAVIIWAGRWVRGSHQDVSSGDELTRFRSLYESGELGREEYERIRAKLGQRLRKELDLPEASKGGASQPPPAAPDERVQAEPRPPEAPPPAPPPA